MRDLSINFCGKNFPTPFLLSSSPVSNTAEMIARGFEAGFGGVAYKTLGADNIKIIHPSPRMQGYHYGSKRLIGLQNVEQITDRPLKDNLQDIKWLKKNYPDNVVIASIMGFSKDEWKYLAKSCEDAGCDMLELNFSCPHMTIEGSGMKVGQAFELLKEFTEIVRSVVKIPILAKLTSNITDITEPAMYAKEGGADGITAINTVRGLAGINLDDFVPSLNVFGKGAISGYSGPAIKPIGLKCVVELAKKKELGLPIAGCGGIETWIDAVEYLLCGATIVQMTTAVIRYGHRVVEDMCEGLSDFMDARGFQGVKDIVGLALTNIHETGDFDLQRQGSAFYDLDRCIGCGQCYIVCQDAGGQVLEWDSKKRKPIPDDEKCYSCMICSFVCPVSDPPVITFREIKNKKPWIPQPSR
ncbi:MAG: NAD-dependent dihydropyrimidine dehydrogenase subunit PreA [Candidatus Hydrogenedentota bacterium]